VVRTVKGESLLGKTRTHGRDIDSGDPLIENDCLTRNVTEKSYCCKQHSIEKDPQNTFLLEKGVHYINFIHFKFVYF